MKNTNLKSCRYMDYMQESRVTAAYHVNAASYRIPVALLVTSHVKHTFRLYTCCSLRLGYRSLGSLTHEHWPLGDVVVVLTHLLLDKMAAIWADNIFKCIFLNENDKFPIQSSLKLVPRNPIDNKPILVQVMA